MKKFLLVGTSPVLKKATLGLLFLLTLAVVQAATITSTSTGGNWSTATTWLSLKTGTIKVTKNSSTVQGSGTLFTTELAVGSILKDLSGATIGTVQTITDATHLTLSSSASQTFNGVQFGIPGTVPTSADAVVITPGATISLSSNATAASLTFNGTTTTGLTSTVAVGTNTLTIVGAISFGSITSGSTANLSASTGTVNAGSVSFANAQGNIMFTGAGTLNVTNGNLGSGGTFTAGTSTVNFTGSGNQVVGPYTYYNLTLSNSGIKNISGVSLVTNNLTLTGSATATTGGNLTVGGNLAVGSGTALTVASGANIGVTGTTSVSGTLTIDAGGTKTFSNDITIAGTWSEVNDPAISFGGSLTNSGTFNAGTGTHTFTGVTPPNRFLSGTLTIPRVAINQPYTNNGTLTVSTNITGNGPLTQATGATLTIGGTFSVALNAGTNVNNVTFNGTAAQLIATPSSFYNLTINNSNGVAFGADQSIAGTLTLTNGILSVQPTFKLTLTNPNAIGGGPFDVTKYIATLVDKTTGAKGVLQVNGITSAYLFPVGDGTYYLPATVTSTTASNFTATAFQGLTKNGQPNGDPLEASRKNVLVDAVWDVNRVSGSGSATVTVGWPNELEGAGFSSVDDVDQGIAIYTGTWDAFTGIPDGDLQTATRTGITTLGPLSVGILGGQIVLPVKFANVKAVQTPNGNVISWSNLTEEDVVSYVVERSGNGRNFAALATVAPASNNNGQADYSSVDREPLNGNNFYRIKVTEGTGKVTYSIIMVLNSKASGTAFAVVPNPVISTEATLQLTNLAAGKYTINVYGTSGQLITSQGMVHAGGSASQSLNMASAKPGFYIVELKGENVRYTQRVIKQ